MASLIEELMMVLDKENSEYLVLLDLAKEKTPVIIQGEVQSLQEMTVKEQMIVSRINALEKKRRDVVTDIATVVNANAGTLTIRNLVQLLKGRPEEQQKLATVHDKLQKTLNELVKINEVNKGLLTESLEMIGFNINLINSMHQAPVTANYSKGAYQVGTQPGSSGFDAKQ